MTSILLALSPFIVFAIIDPFTSPVWALMAAAVTSAVSIDREILACRAPKLLPIGCFVVFVGLAAYSFVTRTAWSVFGVRLWVVIVIADAVLLSMPVPKSAGVAVIVLALYGAFRFTMWYPQHLRAKS